MSKKRFLKGVASFYVVAFSTLVLVIIATSFAAIVINEVARSSNDDLAQSAYDSALAGVEDAKLALHNYQACLNQGATASSTKPTGSGSLTCAEILWYMEHPDCNMVGRILGRIGKDEEPEGGVMIEETETNSNMMQQAYTCVKVLTELNDYRSSLTEENPTRVIRVRLARASANDIKRFRVSWYSETDSSELAFSNVLLTDTKRMVQFPSLKTSRAATPPTIGVGIVQTAQAFNLSDFDKVTSDATNRGMVYLVPSNNQAFAKESKADNYIGIYKADLDDNYLEKSYLVKSNDRSVKNLPFVVYCDSNNEFVCSAMLELPSVIGGARSDDSFIVTLSIPYGQPSTDFALEFFCSDGSSCGTMVIDGEEVATAQATLSGMQVTVDSTGRANDLYRRVEARLDTTGTSFPYPLYALELLGNNSGKALLSKNMTVTSEYSANTYANNLNSLFAK